MEELIYEKSVEYLKTDLFKHLPTLKYLSLYYNKATISLVEDTPQWAVSVTIPTDILTYDTATYPEAKKAVFINGTSRELKYKLLDTLSEDNYILRLNEDLDLSKFNNRFNIHRGNAFISYSCSTFNDVPTDFIIPPNTIITDEAVNLIIKTDHTESDIRKYFDNGALWFGLTINNELKSICFVYHNYGDIWEIAGVYTLETERNKSYARIVVNSALKYILERNLMPRYVTDERNINSVKLARSLRMKQFLKIEHFLLNPW